MEYEGDSDTNYDWCTWNNSEGISKGTGRLGNRRTRGDHLDYNIVKIGQNTEKSPRDETSCHSNSNEKLSANACGKILKRE